MKGKENKERKMIPELIAEKLDLLPLEGEGGMYRRTYEGTLMENGGKATVYTVNGGSHEIRAASDGLSFISNKVNIKPPWQYKVFDIIVDLLVSQGGTAEKGNGRNYKLGEGKCTEKTVVGAIGYHYSGKSFGDSVYDPVFFLAAILEWAGIAHNGRGELTLTDSYRKKINL